MADRSQRSQEKAACDCEWNRHSQSLQEILNNNETLACIAGCTLAVGQKYALQVRTLCQLGELDEANPPDSIENVPVSFTCSKKSSH